MKKFYFIILLNFIGFSLFAQGPAPELPAIKWLNWNEAYNKSYASDKIILIDLYTDWCGWCKKMDKETFTDAEIVELINQYFIPVKLNPEKNGETYFYKGQQVTAQQLLKLLSKDQQLKYPAILIYYKDNNEIYSEEGFQKANTFKQLLKIYVNHQEKLASRAMK